MLALRDRTIGVVSPDPLITLETNFPGRSTRVILGNFLDPRATVCRDFAGHQARAVSVSNFPTWLREIVPERHYMAASRNNKVFRIPVNANLHIAVQIAVSTDLVLHGRMAILDPVIVTLLVVVLRDQPRAASQPVESTIIFRHTVGTAENALVPAHGVDLRVGVAKAKWGASSLFRRDNRWQPALDVQHGRSGRKLALAENGSHKRKKKCRHLLVGYK